MRRWLGWIPGWPIVRAGFNKYSASTVDREHAKFREFRGVGRTVVAVGDDDGLPITRTVEDLLEQILLELKVISLGIEVLVDQPLRKEDAA